MRRLVCIVSLFILFGWLVGCKKYIPPYDMAPRPIDVGAMLNYLGKGAEEVRGELSRTLLMVDYTSPVFDSAGVVQGKGMTTLLAYDNARPAWSSDDFTTFILTDTLQRVNVGIVQRAGMEKERNLYMWELWRDYVYPLVGGGGWQLGVYSMAENMEGVSFNRHEELTGESVRSICESFKSFYEASTSFKYLHFSLYATDGVRMVQLLQTQYLEQRRVIIVHQIQVALLGKDD